MSDKRDLRARESGRGPAPSGRTAETREGGDLVARLAGPLSPAELSAIARRHLRALQRPAHARALLCHAALPASLARDLGASLPWRAVAESAIDPRCPAPVRRALSEALAKRALSLGSGERVALARLAPENVLEVLARLDDERVLRAVLTAPRAGAGIARAIAERPDLPLETLRILLSGTRFTSLLPPPATAASGAGVVSGDDTADDLRENSAAGPAGAPERRGRG
ncbi:MAG: hypothetical protein OEQ13_05070 [Acidobacteriota bacterium]|nr:hypothetical protein [Acidobacteriota bacterium]